MIPLRRSARALGRPGAAAVCVALALGLALAALIPLPSARAQSDFTWYVSETVVKGKEQPTFTLIPPVDLTKVVLRVTDDKGGSIAKVAGPVKAGEKAEIVWTQPPGRRAYQGSMAFWIDESEYELQVKFAIVVGTPPTLTVPVDKIDDDAHTLVVTSNQPAGTGEVVVIGEGGAELLRDTVAFKGEKPGSPLTLTWGPTQGTPLRIDIKVTDPFGFPGAYTLWPWAYAVPHEEVIFASGQAAIQATEEPKLDATWQEIQKVLARYGDVVEMNLYVAGYTDTVDDASYNLRLSGERARSIARYFKEKGFSRPIYYQGFGESALAVPTADGVDEQANRRAHYVLSAQPPRDRSQFPRGDWKALK